MEKITPFTIDIPDQQIEDLQKRIELTRWPEEECVDDWTQGIPLSYTKELADYWATEYDWRQSEKQLNRFTQFITNVNDLDIHFIHQRSPHENAMPLITHGWPGSTVEFHKVIEPPQTQRLLEERPKMHSMLSAQPFLAMVSQASQQRQDGE